MKFVRNFTTGEIACGHGNCPYCGGKENIADSTIEKLQSARDYLERPIYVNSGCRCDRRNEIVGGVRDSSHLYSATRQSHAADVTLVSPEKSRPLTYEETALLFIALYEAGFRRWGIHDYYIHADDDPRKRSPRMWTC